MSSYGSSKHVLMFGSDGMGAFVQNASTPHMDALFANGATTYTALSQRPTISGQCWTSMLTGALPDIHKLTNDHMEPIPELPTVLGMVRKARPQAEIAAFTVWKAIAFNIIGEASGANKLDSSPDDDELIDRVIEYLDTHEPTFMFVQLDLCDSAGHEAGYGSEYHLQSVTHADELFGKVISKYKQKGWFDDTLFMVSADHGGSPRGSHGAWTDSEKYVFLGVAGPQVCHGHIGDVCLRDYPSIALWALGIDAPSFTPDGYAGQLPSGVFADAGNGIRLEATSKQQFFDVAPEPVRGSKEWIGNFIPEESIKLFINFENGIDDVSGHCTTYMESGFIKHYNNGIRGQSGEFGNGIMHVDGIEHGPVFTLAFWHLVSYENDSWLDVLTTKDGIHKAFSISAADGGMGIYLKEPNGSEPHRLQRVGDEGLNQTAWTHFMFVVDTVQNTLTGYLNFGRKRTDHIPFPIAPHFNFSSFRSGVNHSDGALKTIDDFLIIDGEVKPEQLKKYYQANFKD